MDIGKGHLSQVHLYRNEVEIDKGDLQQNIYTVTGMTLTKMILVKYIIYHNRNDMDKNDPRQVQPITGMTLTKMILIKYCTRIDIDKSDPSQVHIYCNRRDIDKDYPRQEHIYCTRLDIGKDYPR